jgi:hypothetical protein
MRSGVDESRLASELIARYGRHAGWIRQAVGWSTYSLRSAERSFDRQIARHEMKIRQATRTGNRQVVQYWENEILVFRQQQQIVRDIVSARHRET